MHHSRPRRAASSVITKRLYAIPTDHVSKFASLSEEERNAALAHSIETAPRHMELMDMMPKEFRSLVKEHGGLFAIFKIWRRGRTLTEATAEAIRPRKNSVLLWQETRELGLSDLDL
jgi:hypothetical protein